MRGGASTAPWGAALASAVLFLSPVTLARGDGHVARVAKYRGDVRVESPGAPGAPGSSASRAVLKAGEGLSEGERVVTGAASFVKILMNDDTVFQVGSHSALLIERFSQGPKGGRRAIYNMLKGKMRSIFVHGAGDGDDLVIKTPSVAMGVRGTEILTDVYRTGDGRETRTDVALVSGRLDVRLAGVDGGAGAYSLSPGDILHVEELDGAVGERSLGRLRREVLDDLVRNKERFLHDALIRHDRSFFKGEEGVFDYDASSSGARGRAGASGGDDGPVAAGAPSAGGPPAGPGPDGKPGDGKPPAVELGPDGKPKERTPSSRRRPPPALDGDRKKMLLDAVRADTARFEGGPLGDASPAAPDPPGKPRDGGAAGRAPASRPPVVPVEPPKPSLLGGAAPSSLPLPSSGGGAAPHQDVKKKVARKQVMLDENRRRRESHKDGEKPPGLDQKNGWRREDDVELGPDGKPKTPELDPDK